MIKRYAISRTIDGNAEYYDGCETAHYDGWSSDRSDADEYRTYSKAKRRADRIGGEVFMFERFSDIPDQFITPMIVPVPALYAGHDSASRLAHQFELVRGATLLAAE
jgi:hypothetical protein